MLHKNDHIRPANKDSTVKSIIPNEISECSLASSGVPGACSSAAVINGMRTYLQTGHPGDPSGDSSSDHTSQHGAHQLDDVAVVAAAKKATGCDTESCAVNALRDPLTHIVGPQEFAGNLANNFKIEGPTDNAWLSNINIDTVLAQWMKKFPQFFAYNFNMRNYMDYSFRDNNLVAAPDTLATIPFCSLYEKGYNCAACVVNNDRYQGGGTHWMAIFIDCRKAPRASCEFFNSAGNDPIPEFVSYLNKSATCIMGLPGKWKADIVRVTRRRHQQSTTECGLYSLFYIWARLNGVPYSYFLDNPVDDQLMFEFRHHLFANNQVGHKFDWAEFTKKVRVDWE